MRHQRKEERDLWEWLRKGLSSLQKGKFKILLLPKDE